MLRQKTIDSKEIEQKNILFNSTPNFIFRSKYTNMRIYSKTLKEIYYFETTLLLVACTTRVYSKPAPEPPSSYFPPSNGGSLSSGNYGPPSLPDRYGPPQQQPIVHKHVYVHVPPPEAPEYKPPKYIPPAAPPQKHYKIVFIKAPTPPTPTAPALPPLPPQDEEKTLIYVLVKKPEEAPEVVLPTQAPTQPSKPEVYFIRYKTQKESQNVEYGPPAQPPSDNYGAPPSSPGGPY